jgi:hypothetical protein
MRMWSSLDWAQRHHDIAVVDYGRTLVVERRIEDSAAVFVEHASDPIPRSTFC